MAKNDAGLLTVSVCFLNIEAVCIKVLLAFRENTVGQASKCPSLRSSSSESFTATSLTFVWEKKRTLTSEQETEVTQASR